MVCFPNCKINIGLYVTGRRSDGYHNLETVFYPLSPAAANDSYLAFRDVLEIVPSSAEELHFSGLTVAGASADNLVLKAYRLMNREFPGQIPALDIYLHKVLPMGAGLGGGSADGAFMLQLINEYCGLGLPTQRLSALALELGSDCPVFIYNTPQFATGRGEEMMPIGINLSACSIQLVCPDLHVSTAAAFAKLTPRPAPYDLRQLSSLPVAEWRGKVSNDFEDTVFRAHPVLGNIKEQLYSQGAVYASMTGTGSAIYGVFSKSARAQVTADVLFDEYYLH